MSLRDLPARPHLDHLKHEAKALRRAFEAEDPTARVRVEAVLGPRDALKLTEAQRVVARDYGFRSWPALVAHVRVSRGVADAVAAFLEAIAAGDRAGAERVLAAEGGIAGVDVHVAAVLGRAEDVRRLVGEDPTRTHAVAGPFEAPPLLWLCHSPFHGESPERDAALADTARVLLDAGADPNATDGRYGVPVLYGVTGVYEVPRIARMLLDAGANPTDGESVFHAAERYHLEVLELLESYGVELNSTGDWGNTPLYFLLRYWDVAGHLPVEKGMRWLLDHGADPNVRCGPERESSLHLAARRGQAVDVVRLLLDHGADIGAKRGDGLTTWKLARRAGHDDLVSLLESAGAEPEPLTPEDELLAACGNGDSAQAARLTSPSLVDDLDAEVLARLPEAAAQGRDAVVEACLAAGFPIDARDAQGATALHHAAIHGNASLARTLLAHGADHRLRDRDHDAAPMGWATFGADYVMDAAGDYPEAVRALLEAGASPGPGLPAHAGVREVLRAAGHDPA